MFLREFVFYVSTGYSFVRKYLAGHKWYTRITPKLILGALPLRSFWDELERTENVTHIVSMLEPFEVKSFVVGSEEAESRGLKHLSLPVRDFVGVPTVEQTLETKILEIHFEPHLRPSPDNLTEVVPFK
ncbi:hypothetical protein CRM22_001120 [Opisthorchis felineus]|uniref:Uncharacterized protein n=1 Tax=Opisthorchis felineus TaxID=147828 RepID=A0A4S2MC36_OPIFE|nr:hypothetical protein CRM22_001120 [Opisthorchis felineus]